ncbi:MAG: M14 family metallopeptidase [Bacteroidota bacterium]
MKHVTLFLLFSLTTSFVSAQWSEELITIPEKTQYAKTSLYSEVMDFIEAIQAKTDLVHVESIGKSLEGRDIPVVVLSDPKVSTPEEALATGKPVMYVQGNIHSGEVEGKEILMILMREILFGDKKHLLENQILIFAPIYNTDSNDNLGVQTRRSQEGSPELTGVRANSQGWDLNRDGMKMDALETRAMIQNVMMRWDPEVLVDLHTTNGTWHGYSLTWAPSYHYAGEKGPYDLTWGQLLPDVTDSVLKKYDIHIGPYGYHNLRAGWPVTQINTYNHHPRYLVNQMGLRNKIGILSEAFAHERFYQRMYSTHAFVTEILEFTNKHARTIVETNNSAEEAAINLVLEGAGVVKKGVRFTMTYLEDIPKYRSYEYIPYSDSLGKTKLARGQRIVTLEGVKNYSGFEATVKSTLPRGYLMPAELGHVAEHLRMLGVDIQVLEKPVSAIGEVFLADSLKKSGRKYEGHFMASIDGQFNAATKTFNPGDYWIDLAQPLANLIFYALEPQSDDGLVTWNFFDDYLEEHGIGAKTVEYPVFKYFELK